MTAATCVDRVRPSPFGSCDFGQLLVHFMNPVLGTASEGVANYSFLLGQSMIQSTSTTITSGPASLGSNASPPIWLLRTLPSRSTAIRNARQPIMVSDPRFVIVNPKKPTLPISMPVTGLKYRLLRPIELGTP